MPAKQTSKGRALEQAVKFIQETILKSSPNLKGSNFTIETNVRDTSSGVLHEIDVLVKTNLDSDYESTWLFECKNWSKPVDKNEVCILAEKVEALRASGGFIVAARLTKEAKAMLQQKKRLEFIRCTDDFLSPFNSAQIIHTVTEPLTIELHVRYRNILPDIELKNIDWKTVDCRLNGQPQNLLLYIKPHVDDLIRKDGQENRLKYSLSGTHWGKAGIRMCFSEREMMFGENEIEYIDIRLQFFVKTARKKILSKFELEGRGRSYSFEPIEDFANGKQLEIHLVQKL